MFVGLGAARVRDLFKQAKDNAPCIVFVDELDALGKARGIGAMGGHDEREQTLDQLLVELDGFDPDMGVILMAATNRPEILDPALLRPGRFDRQVLVDRPDKMGRKDILAVHLKKLTAVDTLDVDVLAGMASGMVGADLANLVNEAALLTVRRKTARVGMAEFEEAIERVVAGLEKKKKQGQFLNAGPESGGDYSEMTAHLISKEIRQIIDQQYNEAVEILKSNRDIIDQAAVKLLENEVIEGDALKALSEAVIERIETKNAAEGSYGRQALAA